VRARLLAHLAVLTVLASGCSISSLQFTNDHRLHFESPANRSQATEPVSVRWTMRDFTVTGPDGKHAKDAGYFVAFVDKAPMPVGKDLRSLAGDDKSCQRDPRCPDETYLNDRSVYTTTKTELTIPILPAPARQRNRNDHTVTVVLVDGAGRRIGESAWSLDFTTPRRGL